MIKEQRQRKIIEYMSDVHQHVSLQKLSDIYQCSDKTIRRDLEYLIGQRNAPWYVFNNLVYKDPSRKTDIELHGYWFNRAELESLFILNQVFENLAPGQLKQQLKPLHIKIQELLQNELTGKNLSQKVRIIEIADRQVDPKTFQVVAQALSEQKRLKINFWNRSTNIHQDRIISPIQLVRYKDNWKVDAWCHHKEGLRTFSLEAIKKIELLALSAKQVQSQYSSHHYQTSYGIFAGIAKHQALLKFSPFIARWVQSEQWHPQQKSEWQKDGSYLLEIPYDKDQELIMDILKYGDQIEVIKPIELREKVKQTIISTLQKYTET